MGVLHNNTYITDKKENRVMRLFVLSSGYVAAFTNSLDETYWGATVIPLGFGSEVSAQRAVDIMQRANPENLVVFSGGLFAYKQHVGCAEVRLRRRLGYTSR
jgi:negative regulator of sigma E activity